MDAVTAQTERKRYKAKSYRLLNIGKGSSVLDTGCGTGDDVLALAELVGPTGKVVGIDYSDSLIEEANQRSIDKQLPVQFSVGDVHNLDFGDNMFLSTFHFSSKKPSMLRDKAITWPGHFGISSIDDTTK